MFLLTFRVHQYIINKYDHKEIQIWLKNPVHQAHERSRGIRKTKTHHYKFVMPIPGSKSSLWHIRCPYFQLMITGSQVNLREDTNTLSLIEQVINARNGILVLISYLVQLPVVYAHPKTPILLLHK